MSANDSGPSTTSARAKMVEMVITALVPSPRGSGIAFVSLAISATASAASSRGWCARCGRGLSSTPTASSTTRPSTPTLPA